MYCWWVFLGIADAVTLAIVRIRVRCNIILSLGAYIFRNNTINRPDKLKLSRNSIKKNQLLVEIILTITLNL